ncbi:MAG: tRNA1(Val) (adenine(37)-N6)-methyltransferase [Lachnospiraceae bacterium]|nr:tRNA1(Val) (adenine(37)-N6)-methyltransferase [Lachnospiraceae bacterium]
MSERIDELMPGRVVIQNPAFFCFGIDAVLLAHFPLLRKKDQVLDLGCGNGVIPLIMSAEADRPGFESVHFTGLELQSPLADLAVRSVQMSGQQERITILNGDLRNSRELFRPASFTLITCNPPYTPAGHGLRNPSAPVSIARHEICATLDDVVGSASWLLKNSGRFALVHRPERLAEIFAALGKYHLSPKRLRMVHPYEGKNANLVLIESVKCGRPGLKTEPPLIVYDRPGQYSREILEIYGMQQDS